jgi:hypothetical protein
MRFIACCLIALSLTGCGYQGYTRILAKNMKTGKRLNATHRNAKRSVNALRTYLPNVETNG